jgi:hypothetical protein
MGPLSASAPKSKTPNKPTEHISPEFLLLQALGDLPMFQRWQVEEHLSRCRSCRNQLLRIAGVIEVFRTEA